MSNIFSSVDIRGRLDDTLTLDDAWNIGKAFSDWLPDEGSVLVMFQEAASQKVCHAIMEGIRLQGRSVVNGENGDTQRLAGLMAETPRAGSVYIDHDAIQHCEIIQLYRDDGTAITVDSGLLEIAELVQAGNFVPAAVKGEELPA